MAGKFQAFGLLNHEAGVVPVMNPVSRCTEMNEHWQWKTNGECDFYFKTTIKRKKRNVWEGKLHKQFVLIFIKANVLLRGLSSSIHVGDLYSPWHT